MKKYIIILLIFAAFGSNAQITTSVISPGGNAKFDTARVFRKDSITKYVTPTQLALKLNISDTAGKWVTGAYRKTASDSVFVIKGGIGVYAFRDSIGSAGASFDSTYIYQEGGLIVETTTTVQTHNPQTYLGNLESERDSTIAGRENHLADVDSRIATMQSKIDTINNLINNQ